jgi:hypothetical protein
MHQLEVCNSIKVICGEIEISFLDLEINLLTNVLHWELATEAHITTIVISIFFRKNIRRYAFGCFQNIVFLVSNIIYKLY